MKKVLIALGLAATATAVWASCTTHTFTSSSGRMVICTTCCNFGNCTTNCY